MASFYTGVGSRRTPGDILDIMESLAMVLGRQGRILRSGGAIGADQAFERGCIRAEGPRQVFFAKDATAQAMSIAAQFHPVWDKLPDYVKHLHGRNAFQVLGLYLQAPSTFLVCWTPDGATTHAERSISTGGTGTAISIADHYHIPIFNLKRQDHLDRISRFVSL